MMINKIRNTIKEYNLIDKGDHILLGLSGGMDSITLLYALLEIKDEYEFNLSVAHLNHGVRGKEADGDEEFCRNLAKDLNINFQSEKVDMHKYAKDNKMSKEAAGRFLRRDFFKRAAAKVGANKIALAHNYNDQVETLLMRIIRGTGIDGLMGISYKSDNIIRPLLSIKREEIEKYIFDRNLPYVEDSTNAENDYHRNKIRNILIPILEKDYNPSIDSSVFNLSELARLDGEFLNNYTELKFAEVCKFKDDKIILNIKKFNKLDLAIQNRIIRLCFKKISGSIKDISLENIKEIISLASLGTGKFIDNISGVKIRNSYDELIFEKTENKDDTFIYQILDLGINIISDNLEIIVENSKFTELEENQILIPKENVNGDLIVRNRKAGDKIRIKGLNGSKKLKDIFIDKKIDRELREKYLIICDLENIYWIYNLLKSELVYNKSNSEEYIKITVKNNDLEEIYA